MSHATTARKRPAPARAASHGKCKCGHTTGRSTPVRRKEQEANVQGSMGGQYAAGPVRRLGIQTKLTVGQVGDPYEREADKVAERVATGQPSGDVSRIPAGGLKAQRKEDEGPGQGGSARMDAQREEDAGMDEGVPLGEDVQRKTEGENGQRRAPDEQAAQRQGKSEEDENAQAKCAACEREEKGQRREQEENAQRQEEDEEGQRKEENDGQRQEQQNTPDAQAQREARTASAAEETAQAKCAACAHEDKDKTVQRQAQNAGGSGAPESGGASATTAAVEGAGAEGAIQRQEEGGGEAGAGGAGEDAQGAGGGGESSIGPECDPAEGGGGDEETAGGETEERADELGCGESEGEGGGGETAEAPEGGQSCGAGGEETAGEGTEGAGGGAGAEPEPSEEADPDPGAGAPVPGCAAATVEAAGAQGNESRTETAPTTGEGGGTDQAASECGTAQRKEGQPEEPVQTARQRSSDPVKREGLDTATASRLIHSRGAGEPLRPTIKHRLEASLGMDVNGIRVHSDSNAHAANRALRARAFTHRNHIFLGAGQSQHDISLMAHEGAHVLQQDGIARRKAAAPEAPGTEAREGAHAGGPGAGAQPTGRATRGRALPSEQAAAAFEPSRTPAAPGAGPSAPPAMPGAPPTAPASGARAATAAGAPALPPAAAAPATLSAAAPPGLSPAGTAKPLAATSTPIAARPATEGKKDEGGATAAAKKGAEKEKPAPEKQAGAAKGARGVGAGGAGVEAGAAAGELTGRADAAAGAVHPGAAAAAAARIAGDRARMAAVSQGLQREASRQKGPAATRRKQQLASRGAAEAASNAAPSPDAEPRSQAEETRVKELEPKKGGKVEKQTFIELVEAKLAAMKTPATLEAMDEFKEHGGAGELKAGLDTQVDEQVAGAKAPLQGPLDAPLQTPPKRKEIGLPEVPAPPLSRPVRARDAAPAPLAEEEVTLEPGREAVDAELATHRLTRARLEKANDPRFTAVQKAREDVHEHANRAPAAFRREETTLRGTTERQLSGAELQTATGMRAAHRLGQAGARVQQSAAVVREAEERRRVATDIEGIYKATEKKVRDKLDWLSGKDGEEGEVDRRFTRGEQSSRENFEDFVDEEMSNWKWRRYGGRASIPLIGGALAAGTWVYDKLAGIDDHPDVVKIFEDGRKLYLSGLRITIRAIADVVESTLTACEGFIDEGKGAVDTYVRDKGLSPSLRKVAKETATLVFERFDELREEVNAKREELADQLVDRYRESEEAIDARVKELQAENRGLVRKFVDKVKEVVAAIRNFRNKIGPILSEAGDVIEDIIDDPIGFLGNLLDAVKRGFGQFKEHIGEHLQKGIVSWLFGTVASMGVEVPKDFSLQSIGGLILQVLGLTYDKLKARAARMVGPRAAGVIEQVADKLGTLFRGGPGALWEELKEEVGDLKDQILDEIKSWVITRIVTAAVKKLAMMFNPVGAIVQAILTIYNVIMFFLENIDRILDLVRTVIRAAADIVRGKIQAAADKIETAMAMTIPLILSFLARLLGLGGIAEKVRQVIGRFKAKIERAITKFLRKLVGGLKKAAAKGVAGAKKLGAALLKRFLPKKTFKAGRATHTLWVRLEGDRPAPVISSQTQHLSDFLDYLASRKKTDFGNDVDPADVDAILKATKKGMPKGKTLLGEIDAVLATMNGLKKSPNAETLLKPHSQKLQKLETAIALVISEMMGSADRGPAPAMPQVKKYQLEGLTAAYSALPQARGDDIERDHQPQTAVLVHVARLRLFANRAIRQHVDEKGAPGGVAISLHQNRHQLGRTYGAAGDQTASAAVTKVNRIVQKPEPPDQRRAEIVDVLRDQAKKDADKIQDAVLDKRETNKTAFGDIWKLTPKAQGISEKEHEASKQKIEIARSVKKQIRTGLDRVRNQDFDRYKEKG